LDHLGPEAFQAADRNAQNQPYLAAQADLPCGGNFAGRMSADDINIDHAIATVAV